MIDWDVIAPMIVAVTFILTTGGVVLLSPLTKRLAELLEATTRQRDDPKVGVDPDGVRNLLETMNSRLALLEERQDFTERLLTERSKRDDG